MSETIANDEKALALGRSLEGIAKVERIGGECAKDVIAVQAPADISMRTA